MNLTEQERQKLIELNRNIAKAERERDETFLMRVLADDLQFRRGNGNVADKEAYRLGIVDSANTYDYVHPEDIEVLSAGEMVVVALKVWAKGVRGKGTATETHFQGIYRNVRLFGRDPESPQGWRCHIWFNEQVAG